VWVVCESVYIFCFSSWFSSYAWRFFVLFCFVFLIKCPVLCMKMLWMMSSPLWEYLPYSLPIVERSPQSKQALSLIKCVLQTFKICLFLGFPNPRPPGVLIESLRCFPQQVLNSNFCLPNTVSPLNTLKKCSFCLSSPWLLSLLPCAAQLTILQGESTC